MNKEEITIFIVVYSIILPVSFLLRKVIREIAEKAISERKLTTGIYRLFPVEGDEAVKLAKGYISGIKIVFWFLILFFPLLFILRLLN
jgi:hypothetical protein